jgi:anti-sigma B factor antagonist
MSKNRYDDERDPETVATEAVLLTDGRRGVTALPEESAGRPHLRVRTIEGPAVVRFEDADLLFEESAVQAVSQQLHCLIEGGHTRLVVNFTGVGYLSSEVLAILAGLQRQVDPPRGRIQLCGLDPLLRDMVRITHLDRVFDICKDEAEALGLLPRC